ncbi:MAG: bacterial Ig-like domain-containing protein, partial [Treponema sp.]|nr:bacterial Ig-like domain-containing protein [Treponema sp.]
MKNTFMARFAHLFGLAALVLAIALCFAACSGGDDGKTLDSIAVTTQPTKTSYNLGENLDLNGMVITATYSDGSTITVAVTGYTTRGYDKNTEGDQTITVTYQGKTAAFTVTVVDPNKDPTPITGVSINIAAPVKAASPSGAAVVNTDNVTAGTVTWSPDDSLFLGGVEYTATVTLTAASGFTFTGLETASVNSQDADVSDNSGSSVTLSYTFPATLDKIVEDMEITAQPDKMIYSHEETLDLSGLAVRLIFDDGTTSGIAFADFADNNITVSPAHGVTLTAADNNGHPVTVSYGEIT